MEIKEISDDLKSKSTYIKKCLGCGEEYKIISRKELEPTYYIKKYLKCSCGEFLQFVVTFK